MSKEPNNIDRLVREKLDGFEMAPPPSVWNATEAAMAKSSGKKRFFLWFFFGIAAIAFIAVGAYYFGQNEAPKTQLTQEKITTSKDQSTLENSSLENKLSKKSEGESKNTAQNELIDSENKGNEFDDNTRTIHSQTKGVSSGDNRSHPFTRGSQSGSGKSKNNSNSFSANPSVGFQSKSNDNFEKGGQSKTTFEANSKSESTNNVSGNNSMNSSNGKTNSEESFTSDATTKSKIGLINSLPISPFQYLGMMRPKLIPSEFEEGTIPVRPPLLKAFSLEASVGVSTFKNKASNKEIDSSFLHALNNAASNRSSLNLRFGVNYHFNSRSSFQTGLDYGASSENYAYETIETTSYEDIDTISFTVDSVTMDTTFNTSTTTVTTSENVSKTVRNYYKRLSIPFQFAWNQPLGIRSKLEFALGGELSIYGKNTGVTLVDSNNVIPSSSAYHTRGMLSLGGSVKYLYQFGNHHAVYVEPWIQFGVTNQFTPQLNYKSLHNRSGIRFGYRFNF